MEDSDKDALSKEYFEKFDSLFFWPLKVMGLSRFDIKNGQIVTKSLSSAIYSINVILLINSCALYIVYKAGYIDEYLLITECIIVWNFDIFHTCLLINIAFMNRASGARFINTAIELDNFLGYKETKFMREVAEKIYFFLSINVGLLQMTVLLVMTFTYMVDISVYLTGAINFFLLYFIYYDLCFFLTLYTFLTLRIRYLNVTIMKIANVNPDYLPDQFPFSIFWNRKFDDAVEFHTRAGAEEITRAFIMIFNQLRCLENCYRFTIFLCLTYLTVGTFVIVQTFIIYVKSTDIDTLRCAAITGWGVLSWIFQISLTKQTDMFYSQIEQTNLICSFIQLKPTYPDRIYNLASSVIRTLEVRDARVSIYGIFYFDTGLLLGIAASLFVYITIQLQLAFPKTNEALILDNTSSTEAI